MPYRIRSQRYVEKNPVGSIRPHPMNPNQGDVDAIAESIDELGFYGACMVQESTGYILAGEHRWKAAIQEGADFVPTIFIDCDDGEALKILGVDNRAADLRSYDDARLVALLQEMRDRTGTLRGSGYSDNDLTGLLARMGSERLAADGYAPNGDPLEGGPEVEGGADGQRRIGGPRADEEEDPEFVDAPDREYRNQYAVAVICNDEAHQREVFERLGALGFKCKVLVV